MRKLDAMLSEESRAQSAHS